MAEHPNVPTALVTIALNASPMLERFYVAGGGNPADLRTDLSHALAAVLLAGATPVEPLTIDLTERRRSQVAYLGPDRRRARVAL